MDDQPTHSLIAKAGSRERLIGIALMCTAVLCFAGLDSTAKWLNRTFDPLFTTWWRYASSVVLVTFLINPVTRPGVFKSKRLTLQILRSILLFGSTILNFFALQYLQLAETMSIIFSTPLIVALLAGPILGEWVGPRRLIAIGVGMSGVILITRPGFGHMHPATFLSVMGTICYAVYAIVTRMLATHDSPQTTMVYSGLAGLVFMTPFLPFVWSMPDAASLTLLVALGFFGGLGHWLLILAHARAPAAILSPFIYTQIIWMLGLGYVLFGDWPDNLTLVGSGIVIGSGLYLLARERAHQDVIAMDREPHSQA